MPWNTRHGINKQVLAVFCAVGLFLLVSGALIGLWSIRNLREEVGRQFNEQQLLVCRSVSAGVARGLNDFRREMILLRDNLVQEGPDLSWGEDTIRRTLSRVLESGAWKIDLVELGAGRMVSYTQQTHKPPVVIPVSPPPGSDLGGIYHNAYGAIPASRIGSEKVWVSRPKSQPWGLGLVLALALSPQSERCLFLHVNISWFLGPFLRDIRSGRTGYAWVIDENGTFLYHTQADFVGENAFTVRERRDAGISQWKINFIQKEKMLKGLEGTGWYTSGWHRGMTGPMQKLIAYTPIPVSDSPPQSWSVAVVAPSSEIEAAVRSGHLRLFLLQGLVIGAIVLGAGAALYIEIRWSRILEARVNDRTEELKKSEERYRSLVESAEDFIFTIDADGCFHSMNSFTATFFGGRAEQFIGKPLSSLFDSQVAEEQAKLIELVFKFGRSVRDEFLLRTGQHQAWIGANFMPLKNEKGQVLTVLCIARDITENKKLEKQLINTEKLASMGTLAAGVAHEINNPLGVILGFCDLLLEKEDPASQRYEDLKTIERQGLHCKQVVANLLSFARQGEGEFDHSDLHHCLREIIKVVQHTLEMKDIELHLEWDETIPAVKGDSRQLQQVFLNLINNAMAAMEKGGVLAIRTHWEREGQKAVLEFEDNGVGIREEHMDRIFEPFFTTKPEGEGTGLGMFVSYGIISRYGGSIACTSQTADCEDGPRGTTFTVKLPLASEEE